MTKGDPASLARGALKAGMAVVDVGANEGKFAEACLEAVGPSGRVYALEPNPACWPKLYEVGATVYGVAAGRETGQRVFYPDRVSTHSSFYAALTNDRQPDLAVDVVTLDSLFDRADLVKIDAQGADNEVLEGATKLLQSCDYWIVEMWPKGLAAAGSSPEAMWDRLTDAGLTVSWMDGSRCERSQIPEFLATHKIYTNWVARR